MKKTREELDRLKTAQNQKSTTTDLSITADSDFPSLQEKNPNRTTQETFDQAPWRDQSRVAALKQSMYLNRQKRQLRKAEAASRFFQPPSDNQGFQYLYVSTKARIPVGKLRSYLRNMGVNNARVLDIHYPDRNVAALLVYKDYTSDFKHLLESKRVHFADHFDPWNGSILKDSKYKDLSEEERTTKACEIQQQRLQRAVLHIREPVKFAVAHYFYQQNWLPKAFIDQLNSSRYGKPEDIFHMEDEDMNDIFDDTTPTGSQPNNAQY